MFFLCAKAGSVLGSGSSKFHCQLCEAWGPQLPRSFLSLPERSNKFLGAAGVSTWGLSCRCRPAACRAGALHRAPRRTLHAGSRSGLAGSVLKHLQINPAFLCPVSAWLHCFAALHASLYRRNCDCTRGRENLTFVKNNFVPGRVLCIVFVNEIILTQHL